MTFAKGERKQWGYSRANPRMIVDRSLDAFAPQPPGSQVPKFTLLHMDYTPWGSRIFA